MAALLYSNSITKPEDEDASMGIEDELGRVLDKISGNKAVYYSRDTDHVALVRGTEMLETHKLEECDDPDTDVADMLDR